MYNVSYDEASGVCTVSETKREANPRRPWTGKMIRGAEGAIIVLCALAVCGLLVRVVRWHARCRRNPVQRQHAQSILGSDRLYRCLSYQYRRYGLSCCASAK